MMPEPVPRAFELLMAERNAAADAALVEVLPYLEGPAQETALKMLIRRGHTPSLAAVVGSFHGAANGLKGLILRHAADLASGIRGAITSDSFDDRAGAVEIIAASDDGPSAYLLADAVRSQCPKTRSLAASALRAMTARCLDRMEAGPAPDEAAALSSQADNLAKALHSAVQGWEVHGQPQLLEAALWMGDRLEGAIRQKLRGPHNTIAQAVNDVLETAPGPRLAAFLMHALAIPQIRDSAVRIISEATDPTFIRAIIAQSHLLGNARIRRGWRWIRDCHWLHHSLDTLMQLDGPAARQAVHLLAAAGGSPERRMQVYRALLEAGCDEMRRAVAEQLIADPSESATKLLVVLASRTEDDLSSEAVREVQRRRARRKEGLHEKGWSTSRPQEQTTDDDTVLRDIRSRLSSGDPLERAHGLRRLRELRLSEGLAEEVYRLSHDPEPVVRSLAVALLADLPGPTAERILWRAVDDPDERVQANAIEALDRLSAPERVRWTENKLGSRVSRVRANAIMSLMRTELHDAAEALLEMLEDPSRAHRLSGLWVIERLRLRTVLGRIDDISRHDPDPQVRQRARRVLSTFCADRMTSMWWHDIAASEAAHDLDGDSA